MNPTNGDVINVLQLNVKGVKLKDLDTMHVFGSFSDDFFGRN